MKIKRERIHFKHFLRLKKDGKKQIILNLKKQQFLEKIHYKREILQSAINAMRKNCNFGSINLVDGFFYISIRERDIKYFRFIHNGQKFQFSALIMGLTLSPKCSPQF